MRRGTLDHALLYARRGLPLPRAARGVDVCRRKGRFELRNRFEKDDVLHRQQNCVATHGDLESERVLYQEVRDDLLSSSWSEIPEKPRRS
jgi:hypothetical protein